jgi:hypothetical protein
VVAAPVGGGPAGPSGGGAMMDIHVVMEGSRKGAR